MPETPSGADQCRRNLEAVTRFACPFCGAEKGDACERVVVAYPSLPPDPIQPHRSRLLLTDLAI